jgi:hypothetical protein
MIQADRKSRTRTKSGVRVNTQKVTCGEVQAKAAPLGFEIEIAARCDVIPRELFARMSEREICWRVWKMELSAMWRYSRNVYEDDGTLKAG